MAAMDQYVLRKTLVQVSKECNECWNEGCSDESIVPILARDMGFGLYREYIWVMSHPACVELRVRTKSDHGSGLGSLVAIFETEWLTPDMIVEAADILIEHV